LETCSKPIEVLSVSKQINFFAHPMDTQRFHDWLLCQYPGIVFIKGKRGPMSGLSLSPLGHEAIMNSAGKLFLVFDWGKQSIVYDSLDDIYPGDYVVDSHKSPVIEYSPSLLDEATKSLRVGRIYWAFKGSLPTEQHHEIRALFSWIRANSKPIPGDKVFRIFEFAAHHVRLLKPWAGPLETNPLYNPKGENAN
jgi:hypothetical protein